MSDLFRSHKVGRNNKLTTLEIKKTSNGTVCKLEGTSIPLRGRDAKQVVCPTQVDWRAVRDELTQPIEIHEWCDEANSIASFERARFYARDYFTPCWLFRPPQCMLVDILMDTGEISPGYLSGTRWVCRYGHGIHRVKGWKLPMLWTSYEVAGIDDAVPELPVARRK